ncbi:NADP-dependent oxidoreductase, partial [Acinetobacter baumannii]
DPVRATTIGVVAATDSPDFAVGDWVMGLNALEDYSVNQAGGFTMKVDVSTVDSPSRFLSALGAVGLTAYFGLIDIAKPQPGET